MKVCIQNDPLWHLCVCEVSKRYDRLTYLRRVCCVELLHICMYKSLHKNWKGSKD